MAYPTIRVYEPDNTTFKVDLTYYTADARWGPKEGTSATDELNEDGEIVAVIDLDHPAASAMSPYDVLRLRGQDGVDRMAGYITDVREVLAQDSEERVIELEAVGLLGELDEAVVEPWVGAGRRPHSQTRVFNVASPAPAMLREGWDEVHAQSRDFAVTQGLRYPEGWAGTQCQWIWSRPSSETQPVGKCPFHTWFQNEDDAQYIPLISADNDFELWIDGVLLGKSPIRYPGYTWWKTFKYPLFLPAGVHDIVIIAENWQSIGLANPAGVIFGLWTTDGEGLSSLQHASGDSSEAVHGVWRCLDYPDPMPGFTAPQIMQVLFDEAQDRGALPGWTINTHGTHEEIPEFTCKVRDSYRSVLAQLAETWVDVWADVAGKVLHMTPKDTGRGSASGLVLTPGQNVTLTTRTTRI